MDEKKYIKCTTDTITDKDDLELGKSFREMVMEAVKHAVKEGIKANSIIINKDFVRVKKSWINNGCSYSELPDMICGLEVFLTDNDLPENYSFAVLEKPQTERERLISQAKAEKAIEILKEICKMWDDNNDYQFKDYAWFEKICKKHGVDKAIYGIREKY